MSLLVLFNVYTGPYTGTGAPSAAAATTSGTFVLSFTGAGAVSATTATHSASGSETFAGIGAVVSGGPSTDGTGTLGFVGVGTLSGQSSTITGTGATSFIGVGSLAAVPASVAGAGSLLFTLAGDLMASSAVTGETGQDEQAFILSGDLVVTAAVSDGVLSSTTTTTTIVVPPSDSTGYYRPAPRRRRANRVHSGHVVARAARVHGRFEVAYPVTLSGATRANRPHASATLVSGFVARGTFVPQTRIQFSGVGHACMMLQANMAPTKSVINGTGYATRGGDKVLLVALLDMTNN